MSIPKVGDKYIIEIGEEYITETEDANDEQCNAPVNLYRIKGFNSLVFDNDALNKLEKYYKSANDNKEKWIQQGRDEAWEAAKKIYNMDVDDFYSVFGTDGAYSCNNAFNNFTPQELIEKIKIYEENKKDLIEVGDEVDCILGMGIVIKIRDGICTILSRDGTTGIVYGGIKKTGRQYNIKSFFKSIGGSND